MSVITVTSTADSGSGSLRGAIAAAKSGDTIQFSKSLARKTVTLSSGQLVLDKNITIDGGSAADIKISGNNASRVFWLDRKKKATIKNLTIANGKTQGAGGGIDTRHESELTLDNVKLYNNISELGGGMRVGHLAKATIINSSFVGNDGTLTERYKGWSSGAIAHNESRGQIIIKGTSFENNKGFVGGAISSFSSVSLTVEDSTFRKNTATRLEGGAIFTDGVSSSGYSSGLANDGKIIIRGSRFEDNSSVGAGGALYLWGYTKQRGYKNDSATIEDSAFINNVASADSNGKSKGGAIWAKMGMDVQNVAFANNVAAQQGGALWTETGLPINISNSTFSGNKALRDAGGAMFLNNRTAPVKIVNSTIAYNQAGRASGALWLSGDHNVTLKNSIVAFNTAQRDRRQDQVGYQPKDGGGNLEFPVSSKVNRVSNKSIVIDPQLGSLQLVNGQLVHSLKPGSPAINAGISRDAPSTDQRGAARDRQVDIGAFEFSETAPSKVKAAAKTAAIAAPLLNPPDSPFVAHFTFDEGSGKYASDRASKSNQSATLTGDATWTTGISQNAVAFDGQGDAVRLKDSSELSGKQAQRTVSLWFKADDVNTNKRQVLYEEGGSSRGLNIYLESDELYVGGWNRPRSESGWLGTWLKADGISADQWHRVDLVLAGGKQVSQNALTGYLDGQQFGSGTGSQLWAHRDGAGIGNIQGSTRFHNGLVASGNSGFSGAIDELAIANAALSSNDLQTFL